MKKTLSFITASLAFFLTPTLVRAQDFDYFNPLVTENSGIVRTPGSLINRFFEYAFPAAGIILFLMILWGGFEMLASATSSKGKDAGKQRITAALIGFILLFASYWLAQIVQVVFGVKFLN